MEGGSPFGRIAEVSLKILMPHYNIPERFPKGGGTITLPRRAGLFF